MSVTLDSIMVLDLEVQNEPWFGNNFGSPHNPDNYVVMHGQAIDKAPFDGEITGARYEKGEPQTWLKIPDNVWMRVAHNASYELDWMLTRQREEIEKFLKRGGIVFCTAYAEYLLSNQQDTYPDLNTTAPKYGGTQKVDAVKLQWERGIRTADIDPALLAEYLLGPEGDIANTRLVFWGQYQKLVDRGMWPMALERMGGLLFNSYAMNSGLKVDRKLAFQHLEEMNAELRTLTTEFQKFREHFPAEVEFKETSAFQMSAWLFGGPIKYRLKVPYDPPQYVKVDCYKFGDTMVQIPEGGITEAQFVECSTTYGNCERYTRGKNAKQPKVHSVATAEEKLKWGEALYQCPPIVDLNLMGEQAAKAFIKEYTGKRFLADETPVISTAEEPLTVLAAQKCFPEQATALLNALMKFAKLDKDVGTYYLREELDDDGNVVKQSGALQYLTPSDFIYHGLQATSTVTGRLSSTRPNFQNLPRGDEDEMHTSRVKEMFVSRFGADGVVMEADYTALEVVVMACLANDTALKKALVSGTDMHCLRLSKKLKEPYEDVLLKCKDENHPQNTHYSQMRTDIKPPSFAYQYGATAMGISFSTGMPVEEAEAFIQNEKELFPGVEAYFSDVVFPTVEANTELHREQADDGSYRVYRTGVFKTQSGTCYQFRQHPKDVWSGGKKVSTMQFKPTQMRNYPIQGEAAFFVQGIAGLIVRWLLSKNFYDGKVFIMNTVHDAYYLDVHKDVVDEVAAQLQAIMQYLPAYFSEKYGYNLDVPFPAAVSFGPSMAAQSHWKPKEQSNA